MYEGREVYVAYRKGNNNQQISSNISKEKLLIAIGSSIPEIMICRMRVAVLYGELAKWQIW